MQNFTIYCTSTFLTVFSSLIQKHKHYLSLGTDLYEFFKELTLETVFEQQQFIDNQAPRYRVIKCRLPNSGKKMSEREGFRLYYNVIVKDATVNLLYVYPKTGPDGQESLNSQFVKSQTKLFVKEKMEGSLRIVKLNQKKHSIEIV